MIITLCITGIFLSSATFLDSVLSKGEHGFLLDETKFPSHHRRKASDVKLGCLVACLLIGLI